MTDLSPDQADEQRARMRASWERAAGGWARQAESVRASGMPVSVWMIEHAELQPGQRVLELAAGPGDTGFLAAELIAPTGHLISTDGSEAMLEVARERARQLGVHNVEFRLLELEWIDLPTADVDVVLCRWGLMLCLDPAAAAAEVRRVLRPGGRLVAAVWDRGDANPAMSLPGAVLADLGLVEPPDPGAPAPGPFALSAPGALEALLEDSGFVEPVTERLAIERRYRTVQAWLAETVDLSMMFNQVWRGLDGQDRQAVVGALEERARAFAAPDGSLVLPGRCIVAAAQA